MLVSKQIIHHIHWKLVKKQKIHKIDKIQQLINIKAEYMHKTGQKGKDKSIKEIKYNAD